MTLVALALPEVHRLGGAIRRTLYRNYLSIEAAQHMHAALCNLSWPQRDGRAAAALPASHDEFTHWIDVERDNITEVGEASLSRNIEDRGNALLRADQPAAPINRRPTTAEFADLHQLIDG